MLYYRMSREEIIKDAIANVENRGSHWREVLLFVKLLDMIKVKINDPDLVTPDEAIHFN